MGSGSSSQTTQSSQLSNQNYNYNQSTTANPYLYSSGAGTLGQAYSLSQAPFRIPVAPVAPFNATENAAFAGFNQVPGQATPYYQQGMGLQNQSVATAAPLYAQDVGLQGQSVSGSAPLFAQGASYEQPGNNPFFAPEVKGVMPLMENVFGEQMSGALGNATQTAGGVGADRIGVAQGELARQQDLAAGSILSQIYGQSESQALQAGLNLATIGSEQAAVAQNAGRNIGTAATEQGALQEQAGLNLGTLAGEETQTQLAALKAQEQAGLIQQAQTQAQLNAPYQNKLQKIAWPYQTAQFGAGIEASLGPLLGSSTTGSGNATGSVVGGSYTQGSQTPSILSQLAGLGPAVSGLGSAAGAASGIFGSGGLLSGLLAFAKDGGRIKGYANGGPVGGPMAAQALAQSHPIQVNPMQWSGQRMAPGGTVWADMEPPGLAEQLEHLKRKYAEGGDIDVGGAAGIPEFSITSIPNMLKHPMPGSEGGIGMSQLPSAHPLSAPDPMAMQAHALGSLPHGMEPPGHLPVPAMDIAKSAGSPMQAFHQAQNDFGGSWQPGGSNFESPDVAGGPGLPDDWGMPAGGFKRGGAVGYDDGGYVDPLSFDPGVTPPDNPTPDPVDAFWTHDFSAPRAETEHDVLGKVNDFWSGKNIGAPQPSPMAPPGNINVPAGDQTFSPESAFSVPPAQKSPIETPAQFAPTNAVPFLAQTANEPAEVSRVEHPVGAPARTEGEQPSPDLQMRAAKAAIAKIESGGRYNEVGPMVLHGHYSGDRALGKYQVMGYDLADRLAKAGLPPMTAQQFLHNPEAQEKEFEHEFGGLMSKHGFKDAASMWHSGVPLSRAIKEGRSDGYITTQGYVSRANKIYEAALRGNLPEEPTADHPVPPADIPSSPVEAQHGVPSPVAARGPQVAQAGPMARPQNPILSGINRFGDALGNFAARVNPDWGMKQLQLEQMQMTMPLYRQEMQRELEALGQNRSGTVQEDLDHLDRATKVIGGHDQDDIKPQGPGGKGPTAPSSQVRTTQQRTPADDYATQHGHPEGATAYMQALQAEMARNNAAMRMSALMPWKQAGLQQRNQQLMAEMQALQREMALSANIPAQQWNKPELYTNQRGETAYAPASAGPHYGEGFTKPETEDDGKDPMNAEAYSRDPDKYYPGQMPAHIVKGQEHVQQEYSHAGESLTERAKLGERLNTLRDILEKYQTGRFEEAKSELIAKADGLGVGGLIGNAFRSGRDPADMEMLLKNATGQLFESLKPLKGRVLEKEYAGAQKMVNDPNMTAEGNKQLLAQAMAMMDYDNKYDNDYIKWYQGHKGADLDSDFDKRWTAANDLHAMKHQRYLEMGVRGAPVPEAKDRPEGFTAIGVNKKTGKTEKRVWQGGQWILAH